ncbi:MAG: hypothetical protein DMF74_21020, partial [Acidobacteria bacterium]
MVTLTVVASGAGTLSYQWYQGDSGNTSVQINGATSSSYTTIPLEDRNGPRFKYWVRVSNACGSVDSATAELVVVLEYECRAWVEPQSAEIDAAVWERITVKVLVSILFSSSPAVGVNVDSQIVESPENRVITQPPVTTNANGIAAFTYSRSTAGFTDFSLSGQDPLGRPFRCKAFAYFSNQGLCPFSLAGPQSPASRSLAYGFRDGVLANTDRGRKYSETYYQNAGELVRLLLFNPRLFSRLSESLQRYQPVMQSLVDREQLVAARLSSSSQADSSVWIAVRRQQPISVTQAELNDVDDLLNSLSNAGASQSLRTSIQQIRSDIHDGDVQAEFGINVVPGEIRALPGACVLQRYKLFGGLSVFGLFTVFGFWTVRGRKRIGHTKCIGCFLFLGLAGCVVLSGCSGNARKETAVTQQANISSEATKQNDEAQSAAQSSTMDPSAQAPTTLTTQTKNQIARAYGALPLSFEANRGQADSGTDFIARGNGYHVALGPTGARMKFGNLDLRLRNGKTALSRLRRPDVRKGSAFPEAAAFLNEATPLFIGRGTASPKMKEDGVSESRRFSAHPWRQSRSPATSMDRSSMIQMRLIGANVSAKAEGLDELPGRSNYFIGNDPTHWRANVPNYARVQYSQVY